MNKLKNQQCYLIGPIDRAKDNGIEWRNQITPKLNKYGVRVLNPLEKPFNININELTVRDDINILKNEKRYSEIRKYKSIRTVDLRMVDKSDFVIAQMSSEVFTCGSMEEIVLANSQKKPVLYWQVDGFDKVPNWIWFMLPTKTIFENEESLLNYLDKVNNNQEEDLGRWYFYV